MGVCNHSIKNLHIYSSLRGRWFIASCKCYKYDLVLFIAIVSNEFLLFESIVFVGLKWTEAFRLCLYKRGGDDWKFFNINIGKNRTPIDEKIYWKTFIRGDVYIFDQIQAFFTYTNLFVQLFPSVILAGFCMGPVRSRTYIRPVLN